MTFKVYYQADKTKRPVRENTQSLYEFVEQLDEKALAYEKQNPNFKLTTF